MYRDEQEPKKAKKKKKKKKKNIQKWQKRGYQS